MTRRTSGFTIVELLIVIVVIAVLAVITVVAFNGFSQRAKDTSDESNVTNVLKKIAENQAIEGKYLPDIILTYDTSNDYGENIGNFSRLVDLGMKPEMMRTADAPAGLATSFVFDWYDSESNTWLSSDPSGDGAIQMMVPAGLPTGYSSWDEVWDAANEFYDEYILTHPEPGPEASSEDWDNFYSALNAALFAAIPGIEAIFNGGDPYEEVSVSKTQLYFIQLLGEGLQSGSSCAYGYYGNDESSSFRCLDGNYQETSITGMKIKYYSRTASTWKEKTVGSGEPFHYTYRYIPS